MAVFTVKLFGESYFVSKKCTLRDAQSELYTFYKDSALQKHTA
jgi:hypothetical protein